MQRATVGASSGAGAPRELLALAGQVRTLNGEALGTACEIAERMVNYVYLQLSPESRAGIRGDLAWLTTAVLRFQAPEDRRPEQLLSIT